MQSGTVTHATSVPSDFHTRYLLNVMTLLGELELSTCINISNFNSMVTGTSCCLLAQEQHWAWQHEAMEAVLAYMRLSTNGDFIQLVPRQLHNPGK